MNITPESRFKAPGAARHLHHHPFWRKRSVRRFAAATVLVALVVGGAVKFFSGGGEQPAPRQVRELKVVKLAPPPPPPPPPPRPEKPLEEKMVEQPKMKMPEMKQDRPLDKPAPNKSPKSDEPPGPLSLDAKGTGPGDIFGLGGKPGGSAYGIGGGGEGGGGGGGSKWGWYASIVQSQIESALRANRKTRSAVMRVEIKLWADSSGRISRVQLGSSTGDAELDNAIRNEVLGGLTLREPPPKDMPMPLVTRVTARRPGGQSELHRNQTPA